LHKVFDFTDRPVREIMVPRIDVAAIAENSLVSDFMKLYAERPVGRFPVYRDTLDDILGVVSMRDVLIGIAKGTVNRNSKIDEMVRPAFFVPETKHIDELLAEMQEKNHRMAVVVDEYGGTAGIVSLTSIVEEIVGPLGNEMASREREYEVIDEHTFQVDGGMRVEEVNEAMGTELPAGEDYETIAGLVLKIMGRVPRQGDRLKYRGLRIVVTRMQGMKVAELLITRGRRERERDAKAPDKIQP
jgi:putative hemolysin